MEIKQGHGISRATLSFEGIASETVLTGQMRSDSMSKAFPGTRFGVR